MKIKYLPKLLRIKHWVKNLFILLPAFFAGKIFDAFNLDGLLTFCAFCLASSSIYILNDWMDISKDQLHPEKMKRPLASGAVSKTAAVIVMAILISLLIVCLLRINAWLPILIYFIMNIAYSIVLKQISIIDILIISLGFVLRVVAGAISTNVFISEWMIIMVFLLSLFMALGKRRSDIMLDINAHDIRPSLKGYSLPLIDSFLTMTLTTILISYLMYSVSEDVTKRLGSDKIYYTSFFVLMGLFRYVQIVLIDNKSSSPVAVLWKDKFIQLTLLLWILSFVYIIYL